jgi:hypothetical protein
MKKLLLAFGLLLATTGLFGSQATHAYAGTPIIDPSYNSRIIDDQVFVNNGTMNVNDIQAFLNSKVPVCDSYHPNADGSTPGTAYICLKDYIDPQVSKRASQIIYEAAQEFGVNPRVILTTLQKEQSLITDTWPYTSQYRSAMGYGCPETQAVCDAQYYGFYNQVHLGTKLLRVGYDRNCGNTSSYPGWTFASKWARGNTTPVDGRDTYLSNCVTGAFYGYTPHRPDSAYTAVNGVYYYGNYNFITTFNSWFGSVWAPVNAWQYLSQSSDKDLTNLPAGEKATLTLVVRNTGTSTWSNSGSNPVRLGTNNPKDRTSDFATPSWVAPNRAASLNESSVAPNQTGTFTFTVQAGKTVGEYSEYFNLVTEGIGWMNDLNAFYHFSVKPANFSYNVTGNTLPANIYTDATATATLTVTNTGNVTWYNDGKFPIDLGTAAPVDRLSQFTGSGWPGLNRPSHLNEASVAPGQTGTFIFQIKAPHVPGNYNETFSPVAENLTWFWQTVANSILVNGTYDSAVVSAPTISLTSGDSATETVTLKNIGTATWVNTPGYNGVKLGTENPHDGSSKFCDSSWVSCNRPVYMSEASVAPNANATFSFKISSTLGQGGNYTESFRALTDSWGWFGATVAVPVHVTAANFSYSITSHNFYSNSSKTTPINPASLSPGQSFWFVVSAKNTGNMPWSNSGLHPIRLGTQGPQDRSSRFYAPGWVAPNRPSTLTEPTVAVGGIGTFEFPMQVPKGGGGYPEVFSLVVDGFSWMSGITSATFIVNSDYRWAYVGQGAYTDASKSTSVNLNNVSPNQRIYVTLSAKNIGSSIWYQGGVYPMHLGTSRGEDRSSPFCDYTWISCNRPAGITQASVATNEVAEFGFYYRIPALPHSTFRDYYSPVVENIGWLGDQGFSFVSVTP